MRPEMIKNWKLLDRWECQSTCVNNGLQVVREGGQRALLALDTVS